MVHGNFRPRGVRGPVRLHPLRSCCLEAFSGPRAGEAHYDLGTDDRPDHPHDPDDHPRDLRCVLVAVGEPRPFRRGADHDGGVGIMGRKGRGGRHLPAGGGPRRRCGLRSRLASAHRPGAVGPPAHRPRPGDHRSGRHLLGRHPGGGGGVPLDLVRPALARRRPRGPCCARSIRPPWPWCARSDCPHRRCRHRRRTPCRLRAALAGTVWVGYGRTLVHIATRARSGAVHRGDRLGHVASLSVDPGGRFLYVALSYPTVSGKAVDAAVLEFDARQRAPRASTPATERGHRLGGRRGAHRRAGRGRGCRSAPGCSGETILLRQSDLAVVGPPRLGVGRRRNLTGSSAG